MQLSKNWTTVTTTSKLIAIILFVSLPFIGFYLGNKYQRLITVEKTVGSNVITQVNKPTPTIFHQSLGNFIDSCLLYTSPSPRDRQKSRMPSSA